MSILQVPRKKKLKIKNSNDKKITRLIPGNVPVFANVALTDQTPVTHPYPAQPTHVFSFLPPLSMLPRHFPQSQLVLSRKETSRTVLVHHRHPQDNVARFLDQGSFLSACLPSPLTFCFLSLCCCVDLRCRSFSFRSCAGTFCDHDSSCPRPPSHEIIPPHSGVSRLFWISEARG